MNPQRERGMRTEREACEVLTELTGFVVKRMANQGIRDDIGDLIGLPDTTIQVSRVPDNPTAINNRARLKLADLALQQQRAATRHGVVLLRIDGAGRRPGVWRALVNARGISLLGGYLHDGQFPASQGWIIRHAPDQLTGGWHYATADRFAATIEQWATDWKTATLTTTKETA